MLNIISSTDDFKKENTIIFKEEIQGEAEIIIQPLQSLLMKELDIDFSYKYLEIDGIIILSIESIEDLKVGIAKVIEKYKNIDKFIIKQESIEDKLLLLFRNVDESFINSIRKVIINEVPTFAFSDFEVIENTSNFPDLIIINNIKYIALKGIKEFNKHIINFKINKKCDRDTE